MMLYRTLNFDQEEILTLRQIKDQSGIWSQSRVLDRASILVLQRTFTKRQLCDSDGLTFARRAYTGTRENVN
jgi:hypothetical protein